jgi:hypothetical protein
VRLLAKLLAREHARASDAVAPGRRSEEDDGRAGDSSAGVCHPAGRDKADAHRVDEAIVAVGAVEDRVPADGRYADAIAVVPDPLDRAVEVPVRLAEPEAVQDGDRPRPHCDDVAEDPADAGRRALERLDSRRVVVALDLEYDRLAFAEIDDAGVLTRPLEDAVAARRQPPQKRRRVLVRAMLRPEQREDRELEVVRFASEQLADSLQLRVRQPERAVERLFGDGRQGKQSSAGR